MSTALLALRPWPPWKADVSRWTYARSLSEVGDRPLRGLRERWRVFIVATESSWWPILTAYRYIEPTWLQMVHKVKFCIWYIILLICLIYEDLVVDFHAGVMTLKALILNRYAGVVHLVSCTYVSVCTRLRRHASTHASKQVISNDLLMRQLWQTKRILNSASKAEQIDS